MYDGAEFSGFQVQPEKRTIQGEIERVLGFLLGKCTKIYASGRTDAGVSALIQVAHFDTEKELSEKKFMGSMNALLPQSVKITKLERAEEGFDARFSVKRKTYRYFFYKFISSLPLYSRATRINDYADIDAMQEACKFLIGKHDFKSFVSRKSGKTDFVRTIYDAKIIQVGEDLFAFEICGDGFLYNMVRIIFGTLVSIGYHQKKPEDMAKIIAAEDRSKAGKTMPAEALLLKKVEY